MDNTIPKTQLFSTLRFNFCHVIPYYLLGIFSQRPTVSKLFRFLRIHPFHPKYCQKLRKKYKSDYIYTRMLFNKVLLVFDVNGIQQILNKSPSIYGVADLKLRGMSYFQPDSVTLSNGHYWHERRQFNEFVLETDKKTHSLAAPFVRSIKTVLLDYTTNNKTPSRWQDFSSLFEQLVQHAVMGKVNIANKTIFKRLMSLMEKANRIFLLRPSAKLTVQDHELRAQLHEPAQNSLLSLCPHAPGSTIVDPERQIPHWLFAMGDTLAANVIRTLLLICTHPDIQAKVLTQLDKIDTITPETANSLDFLEHCTQEAMRLWPTTSMLARKMNTRDTLQGKILPVGTTLIILNNAMHRDTIYQEDANLFKPERWEKTEIDYAYNHLSNGTQICAGKYLALLLAKTMLAQLLKTWKFSVTSPSIKAGHAIPYINNYFSIRFRVKKREG